MKQQVNLYLPEFKVKKDPMTILLMGQILGGVLVFMIMISGYQLIERWQLNSELDQLRAILEEETRKTDELDSVLARRSQNDDLIERLEVAEERLQSRRQIRDFLGETQLGNVVGFSEYFKDLSRASIEGLSLSEFSFRNGGADVSISGQVVDSSMVPRYVNNLQSANSSLRNKNFSPSISRSDMASKYFSFSLSSTSE